MLFFMQYSVERKLNMTTPFSSSNYFGAYTKQKWINFIPLSLDVAAGLRPFCKLLPVSFVPSIWKPSREFSSC